MQKQRMDECGRAGCVRIAKYSHDFGYHLQPGLNFAVFDAAPGFVRKPLQISLCERVGTNHTHGYYTSRTFA